MKTLRHRQIHQLVNNNGAVAVAELQQLLNVSEATIRRDLEEMDRRGWVRRKHGGAVRVERVMKEPPIGQRQQKAVAAKERIGRYAASLVKEGQTIFLGSGSTVHEIARNLHNTPNLTVITNALNVANELSQRNNIELIIIGGMFRPSEMSMVGHIAEQAIREFRADHVFMGMRAIDPVHGFTNDYLPEATTDRAILKMASHVVVVADAAKFGSVSTVYLAPVTVAHTIITDPNASTTIVEELRELEITVHIS